MPKTLTLLQLEEEKKREEDDEEEEEEEEEEHDHHDDNNQIIIPSIQDTNERQIVVSRSRSASYRLRKAGLQLRFLLGPLARKRSQPPKATPTGISCGLSPFLTGRKQHHAEWMQAWRGQSSKSKKKNQVAAPKQQIGWVQGGSRTALFVLMMDLRKKINLFRGIFDLPTSDVSASINQLVMDTMADLHNLYPEIMPIKKLSDIKQGISIHEVLIYLCGALRSVGDSWGTTNQEWMDEATLYKQNNMDELSSEQLVDLALATLNCLIKIQKEDPEMTDEEDDHSKAIVPRGKLLLKSYSETNAPFSVASPVETPTSIVPEFCSSPRAKEFSNLYCSSPLLRFLSFQSVGKLNRIDIKKLPFHLFPHGISQGHHKNNEAKNKPCKQPGEEPMSEMDGSQSSEDQIDTADADDETREIDTIIPTTVQSPESTMLSEEHNSSSMKEEDTTAAAAASVPPQPLPSTMGIEMTRGSQPPKPPPLPHLCVSSGRIKSEAPLPPPPPPVPTRRQLVSQLQPLAPTTIEENERPSSSSPLSLHIPDTVQAVPPPPPPLQKTSDGEKPSSSRAWPSSSTLQRASSNGSASQSIDGPAPPPPPPGAAKLLRPRRGQSKLKRSSQMGNLYRALKGRVEGGNQIRRQNGKESPNSNNGGRKLGMADALAEITKRSAYFRQIQEDVQTYAEEINMLKREISSFKTKDMTELVNFYNHVESVLENLTDESQVLARFEGFPQKKLEATRSAAALYCKLKGVVTDLQAWKIESPLERLLDRIERYFSKMNGELDAFERIKEEECKKFKNHNIEFDLQILVQIKEAVVDLSSNCMELAMKERRDAEKSGAQPSKACCKTLWRAFQFAFRVYTFAGGHDDRADRLTRELAKQIEEDYRQMQENP
ncbi:Uncharacterized protein At4g04980 [Linum grandiflorum]